MAWITPLVAGTISPQGANAPPAASERRVHENTSTSDRRTGRWLHPSTSRQVEAPFSAAATATLKLKLTAAGQQLLKHAKHLKLTAKATFTAVGGKPVSVTKTLMLKR